MGKKVTAENKEFAGSGVEGDKAVDTVEETPAEKTYVTGEDVLATLRDKGVRI